MPPKGKGKALPRPGPPPALEPPPTHDTPYVLIPAAKSIRRKKFKKLVEPYNADARQQLRMLARTPEAGAAGAAGAGVPGQPSDIDWDAIRAEFASGSARTGARTPEAVSGSLVLGWSPVWDTNPDPNPLVASAPGAPGRAAGLRRAGPLPAERPAGGPPPLIPIRPGVPGQAGQPAAPGPIPAAVLAQAAAAPAAAAPQQPFWRRGLIARPTKQEFGRAFAEALTGGVATELIQQALPAEYARLVEVLGIVPIASALFRGESPIPAIIMTVSFGATRNFIRALARFIDAAADYHKSDKKPEDKKAFKAAWVDFLKHPIDVPIETMQKAAAFSASLADRSVQYTKAAKRKIEAATMEAKKAKASARKAQKQVRALKEGKKEGGKEKGSNVKGVWYQT